MFPSHSQMSPFQQLPYRIAFCTGEDPGHLACELLLPLPLGLGWESPPFTSESHILILQFMGRVDLKQIQFLSHHTKIASKIEISTYSLSGAVLNEDIPREKFRRIGHLSLGSNESTGYSVSELKSVYINASADYIKLAFGKPFPNKFNPLRQVGIIAINFFGQQSEKSGLTLTPDQIVSERMQLYEMLKSGAVRREEFERAKGIKGLLDQIMNLHTHIQGLEQQKGMAIQNEDYDRARMLNMEIHRQYINILIDPFGVQSAPHSMLMPPQGIAKPVVQPQSIKKPDLAKPMPYEKKQPIMKQKKGISEPTVAPLVNEEQGERAPPNFARSALAKMRKNAERFLSNFK